MAPLRAPFGVSSGASVVLVRRVFHLARMKTNWKPIKKVAAGFVAAGITWVALKLGVSFGASEVNEAATGLVGLVVAYLVPDKRVTN